MIDSEEIDLMTNESFEDSNLFAIRSPKIHLCFSDNNETIHGFFVDELKPFIFSYNIVNQKYIAPYQLEFNSIGTSCFDFYIKSIMNFNNKLILIKNTIKNDPHPFLIINSDRSKIYALVIRIGFDILFSGIAYYNSKLIFLNSLDIRSLTVVNQIGKVDLTSMTYEKQVIKQLPLNRQFFDSFLVSTNDSLLAIGGYTSIFDFKESLHASNINSIRINTSSWELSTDFSKELKNTSYIFTDNKSIIVFIQENNYIKEIKSLNNDEITNYKIKDKLKIPKRVV